MYDYVYVYKHTYTDTNTHGNLTGTHVPLGTSKQPGGLKAEHRACLAVSWPLAPGRRTPKLQPDCNLYPLIATILDNSSGSRYAYVVSAAPSQLLGWRGRI